MDKDYISGSQLTILIAAFCLGSAIVLSPGSAVGSGWVAVILGTAEGLLLALVYTTLSERFGHQSFVVTAQQVLGRIPGMIASLLLIWFMLQLGGLVLGNFGDYFNIAVLQESPVIMFVIPLALVVTYAVSKGIAVIARVATLLLPVTIVLLILLSIALLGQATPENLLPILDTDLKSLLTTAHRWAVFPFAETVVFVMVLPQLPRKRNARNPILLGITLGGLLLALDSISNTAALGAAIENTVFPAHASARLIEVGKVFTRVEILVAANFLTMGFVKVAVLLYGASTGIAQVCGMRAYQPLVLPLGVLMVILSVTGLQHGFAESLVFAKEVWPYYAPIFTTGLPLLVLLTAIITRKPREGGAK